MSTSCAFRWAYGEIVLLLFAGRYIRPVHPRGGGLFGLVSPPCEGARREQIRGAEVHSISSTSASQASTSEEESLATTLHRRGADAVVYSARHSSSVRVVAVMCRGSLPRRRYAPQALLSRSPCSVGLAAAVLPFVVVLQCVLLYVYAHSLRRRLNLHNDRAARSRIISPI